MSILLAFFIWYLIGFFTLLILCISSGELSIRDFLHCTLYGLCGLLIWIIGIYCFIFEYMNNHNITLERILDIKLYKKEIKEDFSN